MSAWIPAPPPESEPAMIEDAREIAHGLYMRTVEAGYFASRCSAQRRTREQFAAAIGAIARERPARAFGAECAFERTDRRVDRSWRQVGAAALAIGTHLKHQRRLRYRLADPVDHGLDLPGIVALGHDADERFGARGADDQPATALELGLGLGDHRLDAARRRAACRPRSAHSSRAAAPDRTDGAVRSRACPSRPARRGSAARRPARRRSSHSRDRMMCPDCSPPTLKPLARIASST